MKKTHKLSKSKFDVEVAKSKKSLSCTIEVTGSTKAIKKDILEMYFESKKSGGSEDSIDTCSIISDEIANITFKTSESMLYIVDSFGGMYMYGGISKIVILIGI